MIEIKIGLSNTLFRGESLKFVLKVATYLEMDWVELKTELLKESFSEVIEIINSKPNYSKIENFSVHSAYRNIDLPNATDKEIKRHEKDLDFAKAIGSDRIIFHAGYFHGDSRKKALKRVIKVIKHYLGYTEGTNINILLENTMLKPSKLCSDPKELKYVLKRIKHDRFGANLDIINLLGVEEEKQKSRYKKIKDWVRHIHISSLPVQEGEFKMKKYLQYFLKELKLKKRLKKKSEKLETMPVILEGKTSLAREMQFYNEILRKIK